TEAAWLAATLARLLPEIDPADRPARADFAGLLGRTSALYSAAVPGRADLPAWALPSAAGVWLRARQSALELAWQGDCVGVVEHGGDVVLVGAADAHPWEREIRSIFGDPDRSRARSGAAIRAAERRSRSRLNQP